MIEAAIWWYIYSLTLAIVVMSLYGMAARPNLLKKLIMFSILGDTANLMAVMLGVHSGLIQPPVFPGISFTDHPLPGVADLESFARTAVDPIPQVLVVTAIVIGLAVLVFLSYVAMLLYAKYGTLDVREIGRRRSE
ncbi:MAG: Na+/H+ antiporter subunit C [Thermoplasmata archaeon]|nr:MAG: Na+/H+ antiporter subunit C [Thermoplasmata archaeon]HDJ27582.1 Na+/H+ antiporter subunit C [Aciduliprofundum sp.]